MPLNHLLLTSHGNHGKHGCQQPRNNNKHDGFALGHDASVLEGTGYGQFAIVTHEEERVCVWYPPRLTQQRKEVAHHAHLDVQENQLIISIKNSLTVPPHCGACTYVRNRGNRVCTKRESKMHFLSSKKLGCFVYKSMSMWRSENFLPIWHNRMTNFEPKTCIFRGFQTFKPN